MHLKQNRRLPLHLSYGGLFQGVSPCMRTPFCPSALTGRLWKCWKSPKAPGREVSDVDTGHLVAPMEEGSQGSRKGTGLLLVLVLTLGLHERSWNPQEGLDPFENYWIKNRIIWAIGLCTDLEPKSKILMVILDFKFPLFISPKGTCLTLRRGSCSCDGCWIRRL